MFNLNVDNRMVMAQHPIDMRIGINGMCGQVKKVGLDPTNGDVYIFVGKSRKIMRRYALDGRYNIDNNPVERNQRPSVIGRKNYLFSKSDSGALDNAIFYSLIESCDIVGVNPLQWLTYVLENLHDDTTSEEIEMMLPYQYKKSRE